MRTSTCVCRTSENCKSIVLQEKCNIEIFLSPDVSEWLFGDIAVMKIYPIWQFAISNLILTGSLSRFYTSTSTRTSK